MFEIQNSLLRTGDFAARLTPVVKLPLLSDPEVDLTIDERLDMSLFELGVGPGFCGEKKYFLAISSLGLSREQGGVRLKVGTECSEIEQLEAQARQIMMNLDSVLAQARIQFAKASKCAAQSQPPTEAA